MVVIKRKQKGKKNPQPRRGRGLGPIRKNLQPIANDSLTDKIARISKLDRYMRPTKTPNVAKLDSNENYVLSRELISNAVSDAVRSIDLREYPIDELDLLYDKLQTYTGLSKRFLAAGSGSDQIIELILSTIGGAQATVFTPTFSYFVNRCELHNIPVFRVPLKQDFTLDSSRFIERAKRSDLVYICSPNNPTGNQFERSTVIEILDAIPKSTLILVDEAYVEFADYSLSKDATQRSNVAILRTMSKAFGLAGARLGYMVTNADFAEIFRSTIQSPYPISTVSLAAASAVLTHANAMKDAVTLVRSERSRMIKRLRAIKSIRVFDSDANFIFVSMGMQHYEPLAKRLLQDLLVVKMFGTVAGYTGCMRITIGPRSVNDKVLDCIEQEAAFN